ncbi:hypothetical protein Hanom_Chr08g00706501 [Helianthus anomalus]
MWVCGTIERGIGDVSRIERGVDEFLVLQLGLRDEFLVILMYSSRERYRVLSEG